MGVRGACWVLAACALAHAQDLGKQITDATFVEGDFFEARCEAPSPGVARFPARPTSFRRVSLFGCAPGAVARALAAVNVSATESLVLLQVPADARIAADALRGLAPSLDALEIKAAGPLLPEPGFLAPLPALRSLWLDRVQPDRLPPNLDVLRLYETGIEVLPAEALTVIVLEVTEHRLKSVEGSESLVLRDCWRLRELTLARVAALPAGFAAACGALQALALRELPARQLPQQLLRNASHLLSFEATSSHLTTLPPDIFAYSPKLREVALTDLGLESLPNELFSGLRKLERLSLARNQLRARDVHALARAASLRDLDLAENPLGDLCPHHSGEVSVFSGLVRLQELQLRSTGLTRLCGDWLRELRGLRALGLARNAVSSVSCAQLLVRRAGPLALVDLSRNPLVRVNCQRADFERADQPTPAQMAKLVMDSRLECECGAYWLTRMLRARRLPEPAPPRCALDQDITKALEMQCSTEVDIDSSASSWVLAAALTLGALVALGALAGALLLTRPRARLRLKALLRRRAEPPDADRPFDAFVAHAEEDERFVAERLAPRLEPARRLCLAYRNWPGGAWIPTQIDESVRRSRRTLCVVSRHFLASQKARAELRAAHAHALHEPTPRLLLLLLDVSAAELDDELRAALGAHAHLRWGEPCFWEKLAYELPEPRPQRPPGPAPPAAA